MRCAGLSVVALVFVVLAAGPAAHAAEPDSAEALFQRLFSPCCYRETLDMHASPIADELRLEIRERVRRGEPSDAILADMVKRYGPEVLTRPPGKGLAVTLFAGAGVLVAALIALAARGAKRAGPLRATRPAAATTRGDDELVDQLDDEIAALE